MINPVQAVIDFVKSLFSGQLTDLLTWANTQLQTINGVQSSGWYTFLVAFVKTFVPFEVIIMCVGVRIPLAFANFIMALVLRIKSFVPTMGGK